jgi:hypothetical protein
MARHEERIPTDEERRMVRFLDNAFVCTWRTSNSGRSLEFQNKYSLYELFDLMMRMGDKGYVLGATLFARKAQDKNVERTVRSHMLTRLARGLHEMQSDGRKEPTEASVANFGRFISVLVGELPEWNVEWAEDMDADDPMRDLQRQPIAVIRGVLLSPSLDQRRCVRFWEMAAASEKFPRRIFSDPCPPDDGAIFSSYHRRAFAIVFTYASAPAVKRFAIHMREHATQKCVRRWCDPPVGGSPGQGKWIVEAAPATENERLSVFRSIAGSIEGNERRKQVHDLFGIDMVAA